MFSSVLCILGGWRVCSLGNLGMKGEGIWVNVHLNLQFQPFRLLVLVVFSL